MTEEGRASLWDLFDQAADLPAPEQRALLDAACRSDPDLRAAVEKLLADDARLRAGGTDFLNSPLVRDSTPSHPNGYSFSCSRRTCLGIDLRLTPWKPSAPIIYSQSTRTTLSPAR